MRFSLWLESLNIKPISTLSRQEVLIIQNNADSNGKHGQVRPGWWDTHLKEEEYYLIDAPLQFIDFDARPEGKVSPLSDSQEKRVNQYMQLTTEPPPIFLQYSVRAKKRGNPMAAAVNGNHRCEVAVRQGKQTIKAIMPKSEFELWIH